MSPLPAFCWLNTGLPLGALGSLVAQGSIVACACCCTFVGTAQAFIPTNSGFAPWIGSASGTRAGNGEPVTLTWSIVPDGTSAPDEDGFRTDSNLIFFLDANFGGPPGGVPSTDWTARPWFGFFQQTFDRWEAISGIDYEYEPNDDGRDLALISGELGKRGDIRIGGRNLDGPGSTLALNYPPNNADMVLDTRDGLFFRNADSNYLHLRNTLAHESGHGLGLEHLVSSTDDLLMERSISTSFDGPQLDEIRGMHFYYGDFYEKQNNHQGNGTAALATDLGNLVAGSPLSVGADADVPSQQVSPDATDFVSISNAADVDFFSFSVAGPSQLDATLIPLGGVFSQAEPGESQSTVDANSLNDLSLTIFDTDRLTPLATSNLTAAGEVEALQDLELSEAGTYYARVTGAEDEIQLYQLSLSIGPDSFLSADFNQDTRVDSSDLAILQSALGISDAGDSDEDGDTDGADFLNWQRQFTGSSGSLTSAQTVPEPATCTLILLGFAATICRTFVRKQKSISENC